MLDTCSKHNCQSHLYFLYLTGFFLLSDLTRAHVLDLLAQRSREQTKFYHQPNWLHEGMALEPHDRQRLDQLGGYDAVKTYMTRATAMMKVDWLDATGISPRTELALSRHGTPAHSELISPGRSARSASLVQSIPPDVNDMDVDLPDAGALVYASRTPDPRPATPCGMSSPS